MFRGYEYVKIKVGNNATLWRCIYYKNQCKGKARTKQIDSKHMVEAYALHNHSPQNEEWKTENIQ